MTQASLLTDLQSIVGPDNARPGEPGWNFVIDGLIPQAVVHPRTYDEVAAVMRYASDNGLAVIPCAHGEFPFVGNTPLRYDIALSVTRLTKIIEYEPADLTVTCQAGTTLTDLGAVLEPNGQMVPIGPSRNGRTGVGPTAGKLLSLGLERTRNLQYGVPRDYTIGMRIVTADGRITRAGGNVVKNVAGYDLCKLYIGSIGTLGVIIEATFKLAPAPQARETIELEFTSWQDACAFTTELYRRGLALWQAGVRRLMRIEDEGCSPLGPLVLCVILSGTTSAVQRSLREIEHFTREVRASPFDAAKLPKRSGRSPDWVNERVPLGVDISVRPSDLLPLVDALDGAAPGGWIDIFPVDGSAHSTWLGAGDDEKLARKIQHAISVLGGTSVISCSPALKRQIDVFGDVPPKTLDLMRRVKQQFDPNGILSPGRFVGRL